MTEQVRGYRHILLARQCFEGSYKPRRYVIACGDANYQLRALRWRNWDRDTVRASGSALTNDCVPFCFNGTFRQYRVRVRAYRIRRCEKDADRYRYTRVRLRYPGARPAGSKPTQVQKVPCIRGDF